jgi:hypothetical protein
MKSFHFFSLIAMVWLPFVISCVSYSNRCLGTGKKVWMHFNKLWIHTAQSCTSKNCSSSQNPSFYHLPVQGKYSCWLNFLISLVTTSWYHYYLWIQDRVLALEDDSLTLLAGKCHGFRRLNCRRSLCCPYLCFNFNSIYWKETKAKTALRKLYPSYVCSCLPCKDGSPVWFLVHWSRVLEQFELAPNCCRSWEPFIWCHVPA